LLFSAGRDAEWIRHADAFSRERIGNDECFGFQSVSAAAYPGGHASARSKKRSGSGCADPATVDQGFEKMVVESINAVRTHTVRVRRLLDAAHRQRLMVLVSPVDWEQHVAFDQPPHLHVEPSTGWSEGLRA
jgi:hypothetical protein